MDTHALKTVETSAKLEFLQTNVERRASGVLGTTLARWPNYIFPPPLSLSPLPISLILARMQIGASHVGERER